MSGVYGSEDFVLKQGLQQIRALSDAASPEEAKRMCRDDSR